MGWLNTIGWLEPGAIDFLAIVPLLILAYLARERPRQATVSSVLAFRALHVMRGQPPAVCRSKGLMEPQDAYGGAVCIHRCRQDQGPYRKRNYKLGYGFPVASVSVPRQEVGAEQPCAAPSNRAHGDGKAAWSWQLVLQQPK